MDITRIPDEDLKRLADEQGPSSPAANILFRLSEKRAKDRQVFAWQVGPYCFIGPAPDAEPKWPWSTWQKARKRRTSE